MHTVIDEDEPRERSGKNGSGDWRICCTGTASERRRVMLFMSAAMNLLFFSWIGVTVVLLGLVIYGNTLSMREEDQLYLNSSEEKMIAVDQRKLLKRMHRLMRVVTTMAVFSAVLLVATAGAWVWIGFHS
jgi:hypothetical protein